MAVVEEFFELFKTPWELYRPGQSYDVMIVTTDQIPAVNCKLLLAYGSGEKSIDASLGLSSGSQHQHTVASGLGESFPIYCGALTFIASNNGAICATAGSEITGFERRLDSLSIVRLGYDLFEEIRFLLAEGQPAEHADVPTLDIHIRMLRSWIVREEIALLEIPPIPAGHSFAVCLTHDIDFVGIRNHKFDHTMFGFVYRSTLGSLRNFLRGRLTLAKLLKSWRAAASLPLVYAGWTTDFWEPFEWYLKAETGLPATYFLIPFKNRTGDNVPGPQAGRRAAKYDLNHLPRETAAILDRGCELGVHGIDAWHSPDSGRNEMAQITAITNQPNAGIRMHWLLHDGNTHSLLDQAGYSYDSTVGYNETIGYRAGTAQVFRPQGVQNLLELPLHIQDGALFYPQRLDLSEREARDRCRVFIKNATQFGGVVTLLWHDRSHGPERFWGDFYLMLLGELKLTGCWFGTAGQVVEWFRKRRQVTFERHENECGSTGVSVRYSGEEIVPPLNLRLHRRSGNGTLSFADTLWNGKNSGEADHILEALFTGSDNRVRAELAIDAN